MGGRMRVVARVVLASCLLAFPTVLGAEDPPPPPPPNACKLEGGAAGPCVLQVKLSERAIAGALPFDVPVFLQGTDAEAEQLKLHVFSAKTAMRLDRQCEVAGKTWEACPDDKRIIKCIGQGVEEVGSAQKEWKWEQVNSPQAVPVKCELQPQAAVWRRADTADNNFVLRVPSLEANRYFALYIERGTKPTLAERQQLENAFASRRDAVLSQAFSSQQGLGYEAWEATLRQSLCAALKEFGERRGVRFEFTDQSLVGCGSADAADRLGVLFSEFANLREQTRFFQEQRDLLRQEAQTAFSQHGDFLLAQPDLLGFRPGEIDQLDVVTPTRFDLVAISRLRAEVTQIAAEAATTRATEIASGMVTALESLEGSLQAVAELAVLPAALADQVVIIQGTTVGSFLTRQRSYISADFGMLYAHDVEQALPYLGTNIYLVPVNKESPLRLNDWSLRRFSVTIGVTLGEFDRRRAEPLFSNMNLVAGAGVRLTEAIRLGGGVVVFRKSHEDPLVSDKSVVYSPYASLSFDWDVRSLIAWFSKLFPST